jgi:hypothetical protein
MNEIVWQVLVVGFFFNRKPGADCALRLIVSQSASSKSIGNWERQAKAAIPVTCALTSGRRLVFCQSIKSFCRFRDQHSFILVISQR